MAARNLELRNRLVAIQSLGSSRANSPVGSEPLSVTPHLPVMQRVQGEGEVGVSAANSPRLEWDDAAHNDPLQQFGGINPQARDEVVDEENVVVTPPRDATPPRVNLPPQQVLEVRNPSVLSNYIHPLNPSAAFLEDPAISRATSYRTVTTTSPPAHIRGRGFLSHRHDLSEPSSPLSQRGSDISLEIARMFQSVGPLGVNRSADHPPPYDDRMGAGPLGPSRLLRGAQFVSHDDLHRALSQRPSFQDLEHGLSHVSRHCVLTLNSNLEQLSASLDQRVHNCHLHSVQVALERIDPALLQVRETYNAYVSDLHARLSQQESSLARLTQHFDNRGEVLHVDISDLQVALQQLQQESVGFRSELLRNSSRLDRVVPSLEGIGTQAGRLSHLETTVAGIDHHVVTQTQDLQAQIHALSSHIRRLESLIPQSVQNPAPGESRALAQPPPPVASSTEAGQCPAGDSPSSFATLPPRASVLSPPADPSGPRSRTDDAESGSFLPPASPSQLSGGARDYPEHNFNLARFCRNARNLIGLIGTITRKSLDHVACKSDVLEVMGTDGKRLEDLKSDLRECERNLTRYQCSDVALLDDVEGCILDTYRWEENLSLLKRRFHVHLQPNSSLIKTLELPRFTGDPMGSTVYEFLETFSRLSEGFTPVQKADTLVTTYLSPKIAETVSGFSKDFSRIKDHLIAHYGSLQRLISQKKASLASLPHPDLDNPSSASVDYLQKVDSFMTQLEGLLDCPYVADKTEVRGLLHTSTFVNDLLRILPPYLLKEFPRVLRKEGEPLSVPGDIQFSVLKDLIHHTWAEHYHFFTVAKGPLPPKPQGGNSKKPPGVKANVAQGPAASNSKKQQGKAPPSAPKNPPIFPCLIHDDHELGICELFFESNIRDRFGHAKTARVCFTCLKKDCLRGSSTCITTNLPPVLVCVECKAAGASRPLSVLLCQNTSHTKPPLADITSALQAYLKVVDVQLLQTTLKGTFNLMFGSAHLTAATAKEFIPRSKSSKFNPNAPIPVFDTHSGDKIDNPSHIVPDVEGETVYIFQSLMLGSSEVLVFYDSGASGHLVKGVVAEQSGFKVMDPSNQRVGCLGSHSLWTGYGVYKAALGSDTQGEFFELNVQGIQEITSVFPRYTWDSVNKECLSLGKLDASQKLPFEVGGRSVDILIGLKNSDLQPKFLFSLPSGLGLYQCPFMDRWGSNLAYGGSSEVISSIHKRFGGFHMTQLSILLTRTIPSFTEYVSGDEDGPSPEKF